MKVPRKKEQAITFYSIEKVQLELRRHKKASKIVRSSFVLQALHELPLSNFMFLHPKKNIGKREIFC